MESGSGQSKPARTLAHREWQSSSESPNNRSNRVLHALSCLVNTTVIVTTKSAARYEGIVSKVTFYGITLKGVKDLSTPGAPRKDSLFIPTATVDSYDPLSDAKPVNSNSLRIEDLFQKIPKGLSQDKYGDTFTISPWNDTRNKEATPASSSSGSNSPYGRLFWSQPQSLENSASVKLKNIGTGVFYREGREWEREREKLLATSGWEKEKNKQLLTRNKERDRRIMELHDEVAMLRDELAKQKRERTEERARDVDRVYHAQMEAEKLREKLDAIERERKDASERLTQVFYQILPLYFVRPSMMEALPKILRGADAQMVVDYLSDILHHSNILQLDERKRALYLLCKIAKSAQVFPKAIELTRVQCDLSQSINEGGYGIIYKGIFDDKTVCVKAVRMYQVGAKRQALRAHAGELVLGTHVMHPNILPFYGAFISNEPTPRICIASPWMEGGSIVDHLHQHPDTPRIPLVSDILSGLHHLHEMAIVHADLKGSNVLISRTQRALLADFGVSRIAMTNPGTTTDSAGTTNWMAPELLTPEEPPPPTRESDMWAFGCVCYEILAGEIPFKEYKPAQLIRVFISGNKIPSRPNPSRSISYASEIWTLAELCFRYDPSKRPNAEQALKIVLDLNVKDERPSAVMDNKMFVQRPRSSIEADRDALVSIIQRADQPY